MRISTAFNHQQRIMSKLVYLYSMSKCFKMPSHELQERVKKEIWQDHAWKKLPGHVRSYISGYQACLWQEYWKEVEWVFPWNREIYKKWDMLPEDGRNYYMSIQPDGVAPTGLHVYKSDNRKPYTGNADAFKAGIV